MSGYVGRLAPSPTGALHLGNVRTFMIAWLRARHEGGKVIFRMEDLDHPKDKPGAAAQAVEDLRWLGFDWDEEYVQSERKAIYRQALQSLCIQTFEHPSIRTIPLVYPCVCSRRDVEAAQSAPHAGEQLHYPGTCRGRFKTWREALASKLASTRLPTANCQLSTTNYKLPTTNLPCWRFAVAPNTVVAFDDAFAGHYEQNVSETLGDFPLARDEFGAGYTLACTVDDLLMGVTEVVRGDDLLPATPAQILLANALAPFLHSRISPFPHFPTSPFPTATFPWSSGATASGWRSATAIRVSPLTATRGSVRRRFSASWRRPAAGRRRGSSLRSATWCLVLIWALSRTSHL